MPMLNDTTRLLNKIERRLGTRVLNLPKEMSKDVWMDEVIANETLDTFSIYFPAKYTYFLTPDRRKGPYFLIDEKLCSSLHVTGCGDINWHLLSRTNPAFGLGTGVTSTLDLFTNGMNMEDIMLTQGLTDLASIYKMGIYVTFEPPNKIAMETNLAKNMIQLYNTIPITLFIKNAKNLSTIDATKMETFEKLATSDVATFLYQQLKYFTNVNTIYASTELPLDTLSDWASKRDEIVQYMEETYVSAGNKNQPIIVSV